MRKRLYVITGIFCLAGLVWVASSKQRKPAPAQMRAIIKSAEQLLTAKKIDQAIEELQDLAEVAPENEQAAFLLGHCYYQKKNYADAARYFLKISADSELYQPALINAAKACLQSANMEQAEAALQRFLEVSPNSPQAITELQWLYFNQLRLREAQNLLRAKLLQAENPYPLLYHLLQMEFKPPIAQESIALLKRINQAEPGQASILLALGYCHWKLGQIEQARDLIEQSLTINPERLETILTAADFYLETGDEQKCETILQPQKAYPVELEKLLQQDDRWHFLKCRLYFQQKELPRALEEMQLALKINPHEIQYLQQCGTIHQASGHYEEAQQMFQKVKILASSHQQLYQIVASGALENPTREDCQQIASYLETLGKPLQARLWKEIASSI
ncbi:tetratricopeptide repeat protein [Gimesia panareensis]|uniref:Tetratricopeptide repeat protein n=1 Tax=Gimesia panareensis TaxID=2527978 RepID=A0A517QAT4_9PLAN|nr:tetratricopeptide repeat protein [Gimesia panareensis]QDT28734.1 tetratricopeptide repeat protein [Gimesia panareensis]QDU51583.1 tetratricopeptide repeat protein [Gimesia panareensis]